MVMFVNYALGLRTKKFTAGARKYPERECPYQQLLKAACEC